MSNPGPSSKGPPKDQLERGSEPPVKRPRAVALDFQLMRRPGYGTKGREVALVCNHFNVKFEPRMTVNHYSVSISTPEERLLRSNVKRRVLESLRDTYGLRNFAFAYDGESALFVAGDLSFKSKEFRVTLTNRRDVEGQRARSSEDEARRRAGNEFVVKIEFAAVVDMNAIAAVNRGERDSRAQDALRVLDIMLREHATKKAYILQRDCYFSPIFGPGADLQDGVEAWKGYHASFRTTQSGLSLNFDTATTIVIKETQVQLFMEEYCKKSIRQFRDEDFTKCKRILKGISVMTYLNQSHKIIGFSPEPCSKQMFALRRRDESGNMLDTEDISVADYFTRVKGINLKSPHLPALDVGRTKKPMYFPIELCTIVPGQRYKKLLNTFQRQGMIRQCKVDPEERVKKINSMMWKNEYNRDELLEAFNVVIDNKMTRFKGRVLEAPQLQFGNRVKEIPRNGRWNFNVERQMNQPAQTTRWIVICFKGRRPVDAQRIGNEMKDVASKKGMRFGDFELFEENDTDHQRKSPLQRVEAMTNRLRTTLVDGTGNPIPAHKFPFVLVILPEKSPDLYIPFKRFCETKMGIITQCIVPPNGGVNPKYLSSVSLKINLKMGGYNSILVGEETKTLPKISQVPTIIFGLDVSHGSPGDANSPSVAAAVATIEWPKFSKYTCSISAQEPKTEMIAGLHSEDTREMGMVKELLNNFFSEARDRGRPDHECKPQQILVYRDGVSESQFDQVLDKELRAFKHACRSMQDGYNPRITFVIVQKRHHTRFFLDSTYKNVQPGTVVDKTVCHPRDNDFYLVSHAAIGTSRPTHYHILYDEIGFTADELQMITHGLCYTYSRCTSAVSVAAPAYYAHVAAAHCRNFVDSSGSSSESIQSGAHVRRAVDSLPKLQKNVLKKMFYA
uniref:Argonaute protein 4B n=1 Tax=Marchantia polymorpha TaxID=3197 RepID=A0A1E1FNQ0_MARPO|nr:argonaute protein 4B [Marchantia polymorpha]